MGEKFRGGFGGTLGNKRKHKDYIENALPKTSLIKIPSSATIQKIMAEELNVSESEIKSELHGDDIVKRESQK